MSGAVDLPTRGLTTHPPLDMLSTPVFIKWASRCHVRSRNHPRAGTRCPARTLFAADRPQPTSSPEIWEQQRSPPRAQQFLKTDLPASDRPPDDPQSHRHRTRRRSEYRQHPCEIHHRVTRPNVTPLRTPPPQRRPRLNAAGELERSSTTPGSAALGPPLNARPPYPQTNKQKNR